MSVTPVATTVGEALRDAAGQLRQTPTQTPRLDAELLVGHVLGRDRAWLLAHPEAELSGAEVGALEAALARRLRGEPIAYIRRFKEWRSLRLRTDRRALIPRPETELLAAVAVAEIGRRLASAARTVAAWDVGTGSAALALAIGTEMRAALAERRLRLVASDVSAEALALAAENVSAHGLADAVTLVEADLLDPAGAKLPRPDVVVANLPYLTSAEVAAGEGSLRHEPHGALDGGPDGLGVIRRLLEGIDRRVSPGAAILLEMGAGHAGAIGAMAPSGASVELVADIGGVERVARIGLAG